MKKILLIIVALLLFNTVVSAAEITVKWVETPNATGYSLSQSVDNGVSWSPAQDVGDVLTFLYTVPDSGLVLVRLGAYNNMGTTWRLDAGAFYNGDWSPLPPSGIGIK